MKSWLFLGFVLGVLTLPSCDSAEEPRTDIHLDGVEEYLFGTTYADVLARAGQPSTIGIIDGSRSWYSLGYDSLGIEFGFHEGVTANKVDSPLDVYLTSYPYKGEAKHGIRIGSTAESLVEAYGLETKRIGGWRFYCQGSKSWHFIVQGDTVTAIGAGFFSDYPNFSGCSEQ